MLQFFEIRLHKLHVDHNLIIFFVHSALVTKIETVKIEKLDTARLHDTTDRQTG